MDDGELDLPIVLFEPSDQTWSLGPQRQDALVEQDRLGRDLGAGLGRMVGEVSGRPR